MESLRACCGGLRRKFDAVVRGNDRGGEEEDESWRERDDPCGVRVDLNVYDLSSRLHGLNESIRKIVHAGAYHAGVVIYTQKFGEIEVSFGGAPKGETGVFVTTPKGVDGQFCYNRTIEMGHSCLEEKEILDLIHRMEDEWPGDSYNVVKRNCCHFSEALLISLRTPRTFPSWINKLAKTGAKLEAGSRAAMHKAMDAARNRLDRLKVLVRKRSRRVSSTNDREKPPVAPLNDADEAAISGDLPGVGKTTTPPSMSSPPRPGPKA